MEMFGHVPRRLPGAELEAHIQDLRTPVRPLLNAAAPGSFTGGPVRFYMGPIFPDMWQLTDPAIDVGG